MADYDEEKYERLANELRALYVDAEQVMLRRVAKRIAKGVTQPGWTEKKAAEISAARQEIEEAIQNLEDRAREAWTPAIEESYRKGWVSGKTDIERFGDTVGTTHLSPNSLKAASILQELDQSISAADRRILRQFDDEYAGIIGKASALMATGSITTREAVQQALTEFADAGISGFTDRAGRRWELGNYAEMAVLTAIEKASVEGYTDTMQAYGYDLAIISSHAGSCPLCEAWEGVIVSVSGENTEYPSLDEAEGAGAFHPRCLHHLETYYEGISEKKWGGKLRSGPREIEEPSKQYTQRSLQRYNERQIRKYKRRMAVAVTPEAERRAYNKVRQWQAAQRQLIDDSDGQLLRQYQREGGRQNLRLQGKLIRVQTKEADLIIKTPSFKLPSSEYKKTLEKRFKHGWRPLRSLYTKIVPDGGAVSNGAANKAEYDHATRSIVMNFSKDAINPRMVGTTWYHEHGHYIDYNSGLGGIQLSKDQKFRDALKSDFDKYVSEWQKSHGLRPYQKQATATGIQQEISALSNHLNGVSDLFGALSGNTMVGNWGHKKGYWNDPDNAPAEAFAHMTDALMSKKDAEKAFKTYFPSALKRYKELIKEADKTWKE